MSQIVFGQKSPKAVRVYSTVHMCLLCAPARPPAPLLTPPSLRKVYIHETHSGGNVAVAAAVPERASGGTPCQTKRASAVAAYSAPVAGSGEPPQVQARPGFIPANTCTSQQFSLEQHSLSLASMYTYSYKYEIMFWHNCRVVEFFPFS